VGLGLLILLATTQPQLSYADGAFEIKDGQSTLTVPLSASLPPLDIRGERLNIRIEETLITFDQRGLGIQYGGKGGFTTLGYMPTNPNVFSADQIKENAELIASGSRSARVSALSGFEVVKDTLYLLLRWDDKNGEPWLEVLAAVDTSGDAPKVNAIGMFDGKSFARGGVSDELYSFGDTVYSPMLAGDGLWIGSYDTFNMRLLYRKVAERVDACHRFGERFYTVTRTPWGAKSVGVLDPAAERFRTVIETRGDVLPSPLTSALVVQEGGERSLFAFGSGAKLALSADAAFAQTPYGVLVWSPKDSPKEAALREPDGWTIVAEWKSSDRR
jgi:hypothetical protein